jgi:hypothetical protein
MLIKFNPLKSGTMNKEGIYPSKIRGKAAKNIIIVVDKYSSDEVESLLGSGCDDKINNGSPSVVLYCSTSLPSFSRTSVAIIFNSSTGNVSGEGSPPANEIIPGSWSNFRISLMADLFMFFAERERRWSMELSIISGFHGNNWFIQVQ